MRAPLLATILLAGTVLPGCALPGGGIASPTLRVEPDRAAFADRVNLTVTLVVDKPWTFTSRGCTYPEVYVNVSGTQRIPLYGYPDVSDSYREATCAASVGEATLQPGTYVRTVSWNGHVNSGNPHPHMGERLDPGIYVIHAYVASMDFQPSADATVQLL